MKLPETDGEEVYRMIEDYLRSPFMIRDADEIVECLRNKRPNHIPFRNWVHLAIGASIVYHAMKKESGA